jgi:hypothetical protein
VRFAVLLAARGLSYDLPASSSGNRGGIVTRNRHGVAVADRAGKQLMEEIA